MARKVVWTFTARNQRKEILEYWIKRTGGKRYSRKLSMAFRKKAQLVLNFKHIGRLTEFEAIRVTSSGHYNFYYTIHGESIIIVCLWDSRRNPNDLLKILKR